MEIAGYLYFDYWVGGRAGWLDDVDVHNLDVLFGLFVVRPDVLDLVDDVQALRGSSEDGVLAVKPRLVSVSLRRSVTL